MPVKILIDTGAFDSYVLESVLSFSEKTDTVDKILMQGMGLDVMPNPVHKMNWDCELVQREVLMGVRPALSIEGVDLSVHHLQQSPSLLWGKNRLKCQGAFLQGQNILMKFFLHTQ